MDAFQDAPFGRLSGRASNGTDSRLDVLSRTSFFASGPPSILHPAASAEVVFFILHLPSEFGGRRAASVRLDLLRFRLRSFAKRTHCFTTEDTEGTENKRAKGKSGLQAAALRCSHGSCR